MNPLIRCLLSAAILLAGCRDAGPREAPSHTVERVLLSTHGLVRLSTEDEARLEAIKKDPDRYLPVFEERYPPASLTEIEGAQDAALFGMAATMVGMMDSDRARGLLISWYVALDDASAAPSGAEDPDLHMMQHAVLGALGTTAVAPVVERVLARLEQVDVARRASGLQYLARSSWRDADVVARLQAIYDSPASPLHRDPMLGSVLQSIQRKRE